MLDKDQERDIIAFYQQGLSVSALSIRFGINNKSIYRMFKKNGITLTPRRRRGRGKRLSQAQKEDIIASYRQGISGPKLAGRYEINSITVYRVLERNGVKRRTSSEIFGKLSQAQKEDIIASYQQGIDGIKLASHYEIGNTAVYRVLERNGVKRRTNSEIFGKLSQEQEEDIIACYRQGIPVSKLASRYEINPTTVYCVLERNGVKRRTSSEIFRKLSQEQEEDIIASYHQGIPVSKLTSRYEIGDHTVYNILERNGVKRRSASGAVIIYPRNEHAFDVIDNEEAAYWLGFIAADGNVSNGRLRIWLSTRDADHIRKFTRWLALDMPIYTGIDNLGRPVSTFEIISKHMVEALDKYGIVPRNTYVMKHLPSIPHTLMRHFLRGYIDGDGYLSIDVKTGAGFGIEAHNKSIVEEIQNWFIQELGVRRTPLIQSGNWHYRQYGNGQVGKIVSYLYSDASVYLDRKYHLAQGILSALER